MTGPQRLRLVLIIGGLSAFGPLSIDMYLPALPSLGQELGGTASVVQLTLTAFMLGLAVGQLVAGSLSDSLGRRRPLIVGLVLYTAASLLCGLAPSLAALIALRFVQGASGAAGTVIARAVVRDHFTGNDVARFFGLTMLVNGLAPILAPIIGGQILLFTSWRGVFILLTAIGAVMLTAVSLGLPESLPPERRRPGGFQSSVAPFRRLALDRVFLGYALAMGLAFGAMFAYISGSPFVLEDIYGISPQAFGLFFGFNALGIVMVSQVGVRLIERVGPRSLLATGLGAAFSGGVLLLVVVVMGGGLAGILPALFLVVASIGLTSPNATALAMADHPEIAGSASAFLGLLQFIIGALVAPLVGIAGTATALPMAIVIASLTGGAGVVFLLLTHPAPRPVELPPRNAPGR
ncbi:MAG: Bcr/CflA family multidrug efflux MFS transporter [Anaerolineae bacterium]